MKKTTLFLKTNRKLLLQVLVLVLLLSPVVLAQNITGTADAELTKFSTTANAGMSTVYKIVKNVGGALCFFWAIFAAVKIRNNKGAWGELGTALAAGLFIFNIKNVMGWFLPTDWLKDLPDWFTMAKTVVQHIA